MGKERGWHSLWKYLHQSCIPHVIQEATSFSLLDLGLSTQRRKTEKILPGIWKYWKTYFIAIEGVAGQLNLVKILSYRL